MLTRCASSLRDVAVEGRGDGGEVFEVEEFPIAGTEEFPGLGNQFDVLKALDGPGDDFAGV